jgi:RND family efflux transporter MFP subunit
MKIVSKTIGWFLVALVVAAGIILSIKLWIQDAPDKGQMPPAYLTRVSVMTVPRAEVTRVIILDGTVQQSSHTIVTTQVPGEVDKVFAEDGQILQTGAPLIHLEDKDIKAAYQHVQMQLGLAQGNLQQARMQPILAQSVSRGKANPALALEESPEQMVRRVSIEKAQEKIESLLNEKVRLQALMQAHTLLMPRDGKILAMKIKAGDIVVANQPVAELDSPEASKVEVILSKAQAEELKTGYPARILLPDAFTKVGMQGHVEKIYALNASSQESAYAKAVVVPDPRFAKTLHRGEKVRVEFEIPGKGAIWLPEEAVQEEDNQAFVYVIKTDGPNHRVLRRDVLTGERSEKGLAVLEGLSSGETIVLEGANLLQHKQEVSIIGAD